MENKKKNLEYTGWRESKQNQERYHTKVKNNRGFSKRFCQRFGKILPIIFCDRIMNKAHE